MDKICKYKSKFDKPPEKLSKLKEQLSALLKNRYRHLKMIYNNDLLVKGGIYEIMHKCGKPTCKCATTSYRHGGYYLYKSECGKTSIKYVKIKDVEKIKKLTENYKKFRKARAELMKIEKEMGEIMNQIEKEKTIIY